VHGVRLSFNWDGRKQTVLEGFVIEKEPRQRLHKHVVSPPNQMKIRLFYDHEFPSLRLLPVKWAGFRTTSQPQVVMDLL